MVAKQTLDPRPEFPVTHTFTGSTSRAVDCSHFSNGTGASVLKPAPPLLHAPGRSRLFSPSGSTTRPCPTAQIDTCPGDGRAALVLRRVAADGDVAVLNLPQQTRQLLFVPPVPAATDFSLRCAARFHVLSQS